jgi:hypothetical protein
VSYEDAQREYDSREPEEPASISLTQEQRFALLVLEALMAEHGCHHIAISIGRRAEVSVRMDGGCGESSEGEIIDAVSVAIGEAKREAAQS